MTAPQISLDHVRQSLALDDFDAAAAAQRMAPVPRGWQKRDSPPQPAAVMILIYSDEDAFLHTVLTLRASGLRGHSGQVSFPGGRQDPEDEDLIATARRETCEEIGIGGERLTVLSQLPSFYIPASHHAVCPAIGHFEGQPDFSPNPDEVAEVFSFALDDLLKPGFKFVERRQIRGYDVRVPYYAVKGHKVWGATAMLLSQLEGRLRQVLPRAALLALA
ncbi:MAG: CoA pyrophosphatase [Chloroflexota bacterium]|nr:CoA pyrophosphatase [Chloroflexota bacterium]MDE2908378.1 CoA pyrophosphatase [Chloroflexota bacterium]